MNVLFIVSMIVEAIFGLGFVLAPDSVVNPLGVTLDEIGIIFARLFGSAILSFAVLLWFARKSDNAEFRLGVVTSMSVFYAMSAVLLLIAELNGLMNTIGWSVVALQAVLALWFYYFLVKMSVKPAREKPNR